MENQEQLIKRLNFDYVLIKELMEVHPADLIHSIGVVCSMKGINIEHKSNLLHISDFIKSVARVKMREIQ
jgi:hypothetical protein